MGVRYRAAEIEDSRAVFRVFEESVRDLGARFGVETITAGSGGGARVDLWESRRPMFEHLARTGDAFWLAEEDGEAVGYARSIRRGSVRQLTEFFVLPGRQSAGVGRELLGRVFSPGDEGHRVIIASPDVRALARYLKTGLSARFPIGRFSGPAAAGRESGGLPAVPIQDTPETLAALGEIDDAVLGYRRDADHAWLLRTRRGFLYRKGGKPAGYGYVGAHSGPFALLVAEDLPAALSHAEGVAAESMPEFGVDVPLVNRTAVAHLLGRGYRLAPFLNFFFSETPPAGFERYLFTTPCFFT